MILHLSMTTKQIEEGKQNLANAGEIRIVLGSTQKLGTGVNVQQK